MSRELYIQREGIAFQKHLQIGIFAQHWMIRGLLNTLLKRKSALSDEIVVETTEWALFWYRGNDDAWIVD
jgi:hypothetical protein